MRVIDYRGAKGIIVARSEHWIKEKCGHNADQIGIVVDLQVYNDSVAGVVIFPVVHWEGAVFSSITHPANLVPYREQDRKKFPEIDIAD